MSLKHFHILFIAISILLAAGFGLWCFLTERGAAVAGSEVMGAVSLVAAVLVFMAARPEAAVAGS